MDNELLAYACLGRQPECGKEIMLRTLLRCFRQGENFYADLAIIKNSAPKAQTKEAAVTPLIVIRHGHGLEQKTPAAGFLRRSGRGDSGTVIVVRIEHYLAQATSAAFRTRRR